MASAMAIACWCGISSSHKYSRWNVERLSMVCSYWVALCRLQAESVRVLAAHASPPHLEAGNVYRDDEQAAQFTRRAGERPHPVPGVRRALEQEAPVTARIERCRHFQLVEGRSGVRLPLALAVE